MLKVASGSTVIQESEYNHEGIRISKTESGAERQYIYDNGSVAYTLDNETLSACNILGGYQNVIGSYRGEDYYTYSKDIQGSTSSITDSNFVEKAIYEYSDFGEVEEVLETIDNEICYTSSIHDETTGLHYMNARYYDPSNGRFISQDSYRGSVNEPSQWHLYVYCANNPINYVDPSGHWVIAMGFKAESALVFGAYGCVAFNFGKNYFAITGSLGAKIVTSGFATVGAFGGYYNKKEVTDLKGWSGYIGVSVGKCIGKVGISTGITIDSKGVSFTGITGSVGVGPSLPIPYWDLELGYTWILKKKKLSSITSKETTTFVVGCKVKFKKFSSYFRVRVPAMSRQFKFYKSSKKLKMERY